MFGSDKKSKEIKNDPEKALDYADRKINKGVTGFMTKAFMGKEFVENTNQMMNTGREAIEMQNNYQNPEQFGLAGTAEVVSVQDTGATVNENPMVMLQLKVKPQFEPPFETTAKVIVSRIAIPRAGDTINIKYLPADHTKISVV